MTTQAPAMDPVNPSAAAGMSTFQRNSTRRLYCQAAMPVPQIAAPLLVPSRVAGCEDGKVANMAGTSTRPPPPTIESRNPANREAREMTASSMRWIVASAGQHERY